MQLDREMLRHPYVAVGTENGEWTYGGNQSWLSTKAERAFGCGLIAAADVLRYLEMDRKAMRIPKAEYLEDIHILVQDFPVKGRLGITGFGLARRMNRIFRRGKLPFKARWSLGRKHFLERLPEMLGEDIPVLMSVGPGFFHKEARLSMYKPVVEKNEPERDDTTHVWKPSDADFRRENSMRDHYVTATGVMTTEEGTTWIRISSWGDRYYIRLDEYLEHVKKYDNFLFSSLLYIRRTR